MRSRDRLADLHHRAVVEDGVYGATVEPAQAPPPGVDDLLLEVERVRNGVLEVRRETQLVRRLHADPTFHTNKQLQEQMEAAVARGGATALRVSTALRVLREQAARVTPPATAAARMTILHAAALRRQFADALDDHHAALDALRDQRLRLLRDQVKLANLDVSEEECESLLDSMNVALFVDNVGAQTAEARRALREAEVRHEELTRVEAALRDVRDMFQQLAHLVAAQQEQLDSVEYFALQATEHVETGGHELLKGTVSRKKTRRKKLSLGVCLAAGCAVVLLVLVLT